MTTRNAKRQQYLDRIKDSTIAHYVQHPLERLDLFKLFLHLYLERLTTAELRAWNAAQIRSTTDDHTDDQAQVPLAPA